MHVYPRQEGQQWRRSVAEIVRRWGLFDRKVIAIAYGDGTDDPEAVEAAFPTDAECFRVRNTTRQEAETHVRLLRRVESLDANDWVFRCHSKGCTHTSDDAASHVWARVMFETCLDYPGLLACAMERYNVLGAFRSTLPVGWPLSPPWHFAGSFYWFRVSSLFSRDWKSGDRFLWWPEAYPGWKFTIEESCCLFFDGAATTHLYDPQSWRRTVLPALEHWRLALAKCGVERNPGIALDFREPPGALLRLQNSGHPA